MASLPSRAAAARGARRRAALALATAALLLLGGCGVLHRDRGGRAAPATVTTAAATSSTAPGAGTTATGADSATSAPPPDGSGAPLAAGQCVDTHSPDTQHAQSVDCGTNAGKVIALRQTTQDGEYPGAISLYADAQPWCKGLAKQQGAGMAVIQYTVLSPSRSSWAAGDRTQACLLIL